MVFFFLMHYLDLALNLLNSLKYNRYIHANRAFIGTVSDRKIDMVCVPKICAHVFKVETVHFRQLECIDVFIAHILIRYRFAY